MFHRDVLSVSARTGRVPGRKSICSQPRNLDPYHLLVRPIRVCELLADGAHTKREETKALLVGVLPEEAQQSLTMGGDTAVLLLEAVHEGSLRHLQTSCPHAVGWWLHLSAWYEMPDTSGQPL